MVRPPSCSRSVDPCFVSVAHGEVPSASSPDVLGRPPGRGGGLYGKSTPTCAPTPKTAIRRPPHPAIAVKVAASRFHERLEQEHQLTDRTLQQ